MGEQFTLLGMFLEAETQEKSEENIFFNSNDWNSVLTMCNNDVGTSKANSAVTYQPNTGVYSLWPVSRAHSHSVTEALLWPVIRAVSLTYDSWFVYCFIKSSFFPCAEMIESYGIILGLDMQWNLNSGCQTVFINNSRLLMTSAAQREKSLVINTREGWHLSVVTLATCHSARSKTLLQVSLTHFCHRLALTAGTNHVRHNAVFHTHSLATRYTFGAQPHAERGNCKGSLVYLKETDLL